MKVKTVSLSFDFEECDLPREYGVDFSLAEGMQVSVPGANAVLDVLARHGVKATFFCTLNFARNAPEVMQRLVAEGHEVAAHGVDHWRPYPVDPARCREELEQLTGVKIAGYRQPRMFPMDNAELKRLGYTYNSSLNPAFIPGRYMHLATPRRPFVKEGLLQVPASVVPGCRFPLFWLALHLLPEWLYLALVRFTLAWDGWFVTYFHPWEFFPLGDHPEWRISHLITRHAGPDMIARLDHFIAALKKSGVVFTTIKEHLEEHS